MRVNNTNNVNNEIGKIMFGNAECSTNEALFNFADQDDNQGLCVEHTNENWKDKYSLENLKKKYPENLYEFSFWDIDETNYIQVNSKNNSDECIVYIFYENNSMRIRDYSTHKNTGINASGNIEYTEDIHWDGVKEGKRTVEGVRYDYTKNQIIEFKRDNNGMNFYEFVKDRDGNPIEEKDRTIGIDKKFYKGKLYKVYGNNIKSGKKNLFSEAIYDDIKGLGTSKKLSDDLRLIDAGNVVEILSDYQLFHDESMISAILNEVGLSKEERIEFVKIITDALSNINDVYCKDIAQKINEEVEYQLNKSGFVNTDYIEIFLSKIEDRKNSKEADTDKANGKIDNDFHQGNAGDCWLIAPIKALTLNPIGKKILEDSLKANDDGSVTVTLKGVDKSYTFSSEAINGNNNLSQGDMDVRAIEMAVDKYFYEQRGSKNKTNARLDIEGNDPHLAFQILTGKGGRSYINNFIDSCKRHFFNGTITEKQIDDFNKENHFAIVSSTHSMEEDIGEEHPLYGHHTYVAVGSDSENVYLLDPKLSISKRIVVPRETFKALYNNIAELDL